MKEKIKSDNENAVATLHRAWPRENRSLASNCTMARTCNPFRRKEMAKNSGSKKITSAIAVFLMIPLPWVGRAEVRISEKFAVNLGEALSAIDRDKRSRSKTDAKLKMFRNICRRSRCSLAFSKNNHNPPCVTDKDRQLENFASQLTRAELLQSIAHEFRLGNSRVNRKTLETFQVH